MSGVTDVIKKLLEESIEAMQLLIRYDTKKYKQ